MCPEGVNEAWSQFPPGFARLFDAGVGEFLGDFGDVFDKFLEGFVIVFVLGLLTDLFPIGVNNKIQDIDPRSHVVFSDLYSDFNDFDWFLSELNSGLLASLMSNKS